MKKNNIVLFLLIISLMFIGMIEIKAQTYSLSKECTGDPFYFKYPSTPTDGLENYIYKVSDWKSNIEQYHDQIGYYDKDTELAALKACSKDDNEFCVRADTCKYKVDNQVVFCLDAITHFAAGETVDYQTASSTVTNEGMACALIELYDKLEFDSNGNVLMNEIDTADIHAIQKKMWSHQYDNEDCTSETKRTVNQQKSGKVTLSTSSAGTDFTYVQGLGYVSKKITVTTDLLKEGTLIGLNLTSAPEGTIISSSNTSKVTVENVSSGSNVYIIVPQNVTTQEIKLTATAQVETSTSIYITSTFTEYTSSSSQKMGIPNLTRSFTPNYTSKSDNLSLTLKLGTITITKHSSKDDIKLAGVKFKLEYCGSDNKCQNPTTITTYDISGNIITDSIATTASDGSITFARLPLGTYKITEVSSAPGYSVDTENSTIITTLTESTLSKGLEVPNNPRNTKISKQDVSGEKEIAGAKICIYKYDKDSKKKGEEVECFTSEDKPYEFYINPGTYILEEELAPEGYEKIETGFVFTIDNNMNIKLLDVKSKNIKVDDDTIIIYNSVVEVPKTGIKASVLTIISSILLVISGVIVFFAVKERKEK